MVQVLGMGVQAEGAATLRKRPATTAGVATPVQATPAAADAPKQKRKRKVDESAGLFRTLLIITAYSSVMYFCLSGFQPVGMRYLSEPWMTSLVSFRAVYVAPLVYVAAVYIACRAMRNFPAQDAFLRSYVQPVYNVVQIVVCSYMVWGLLPTVDVANGNPFGLHSKRSASVEWFVFVHYLTKYLDWCDTFFMIAKKKFNQVSFLQVFHHATIGMIWGALLSVGWGSGTVAYGAFINSVTHVIMYTHYFYTSFGFENPLKAWVTRFQLAQFFSCIVHAVLAASYESVVPKRLTYIQVMYHPIMIALFGVYINWAPKWLTGGSA